MGYHTEKTQHWTGYNLPTQVANRVGDIATPWRDTDNLKNNSLSSYSQMNYSATGGSAESTGSIFFYGYGFDSVVPLGAKILRIDTRAMVSSQVTNGIPKIGWHVIRLRTQDDNTNLGWGSTRYGEEDWPANPTERDVTGSAQPGESDSWGGTEIYDAHVRSSNFGCRLQGSIPANSPKGWVRLYHVYMRVQYELSTQVWVDPIYSLSLGLNPNTIKSDGSNPSTLSILHANTNNESGTLPSTTVTIQNNGVCCFSDGTFTKTIGSRSTSAGQTLTDNLTIIGLNIGTSTITVKCGSNTKTINMNVEQAFVPPVYSCTPVLTSNNIKKDANTTLNIALKNTNNVAGTLPSTTIKTTGNAKIVVNNNQVTSTSMPLESFGANATKTYSFTIVGASIGSDTITIQNDSFGTKTLPITVSAPDPRVSINATKAGISYPELPDTVRYAIKNIGEVPLPLTSLVLNAVNPLRFTPNNLTTKTVNINKTLAVNQTEEIDIEFIGLATGTGAINATLTGYGTLNTPFIFSPLGVYSSTVSVTPNEVDVGGVFQLKLNYTNTNNVRGLTPETIVNLPSGITTLDGKSTYTFNRVELEANGNVNLNVNLVGTIKGNKTITCAGKTVSVTINEVILPTPILSSNWAYSTKTTLYPNDIGQLIVQYDVVNNIYPATIPPTTISISGNAVEFTSAPLNSRSISQQTLQTGQSYSNENDNQIYFKFKSPGTSTITLSNSLLGTKTINVTSSYRGADFVSSTSVSPNIITHVEGGAIINATLNNSNIGDVSGTLNGATITLTGDVLQFSDGTTTKVLPNRTIAVNQNIMEELLIYTTSAGTGTIRIINEQNNFNYETQVTVEAPLVPEYSIGLSCSQPSIPVWTSEEQVSSPLKITYTNTNLLAGTTPELVVYLEGDLKFTNNNSSFVVSPKTVGRGETLEYVLPNEIKSATVGTFVIRLYDENIDMDISKCTIDVRGSTPINKGWVNLENCEFEQNKGNNGGAVYNDGKYYSTNLKFKNNTSENKCPNIYDNGVCK